MSDDLQLCTICRQPLAANGRCPQCDPEGHVWNIGDWRPLATLALVIALGFSFTRLVVNGFNQMQSALATRYATRGNQALAEHRAQAAVRAYESALVYARNNPEFRLRLTDALIASGAREEARSQLRDYREQAPQDALVNLKLARLEAQSSRSEEALRYYREAIDGAWPAADGMEKDRVQLEVAAYLNLLGRHAESEGVLVALADALPTGSAMQLPLADQFLKNGDSERALDIYEVLVLRNRNDVAAVLGAAQAELAEGNYPGARKYLVLLPASNAEGARLLAELDRLEAIDPFSRSIKPRERAERTIAAYRIALRRLAGCGAPFAIAITTGAAPPKAEDPMQWDGFAKWADQLHPWMDERKLRGRDDLIESAMRFAFQAEMSARKGCAPATVDDEALLLLARQRMGVGR